MSQTRVIPRAGHPLRDLITILQQVERFVTLFGEIGGSPFSSMVIVITGDSAHDHGVHCGVSGKESAMRDEPPPLRLIEQPLCWKTPPAKGPDDLIEKEHHICLLVFLIAQ